jgi:hypothetical protein
MKISKAHQRFSEELNESRALTHPQEYLGLNWRDVINFWFYIDTLSWGEKKMNDRYRTLKYYVRLSNIDAVLYAAMEVVGREVRNAAWNAVADVTAYGVFGWITYELISHHKLLEQNKTLVALPLCFTSCDH